MEVIFSNRYLKELVENEGKAKGKPQYPPQVIKGFLRKIKMLRAYTRAECQLIPGLNWEMLTGNKAGLHSIRINKKYRIEFIPSTDGKIEIVDIQNLSNHYGN
mgnify:CR=1 FL=1